MKYSKYEIILLPFGKNRSINNESVNHKENK